MAVSIAVGDNPTECVLNTPQFAHFEIEQTSEKGIAEVDYSLGHLPPE